MGQNPAVGGQNTGRRAARPGQPRLAGRARPLRERDRRLLVRLAGGRAGELRPEEIKTEVFLSAGRADRREGRLLHQHPAARPVARQGRRRRPATPAPKPGSSTISAGGCGALRRRRRASATGRCCDLTWDYPTHGPHARAGHRGTSCARSTATRAPTGAAASPASRSSGTTARPPAAAGSTAGMLRRRRQPGARRRTRRADAAGVRVSAGASPGRPTGASSTTAPPPTRRHAVVGAQALGLVGRRARAAGPATTCPTSRPTKPPDYAPPPDATGIDAHPATTRS